MFQKARVRHSAVPVKAWTTSNTSAATHRPIGKTMSIGWMGCREIRARVCAMQIPPLTSLSVHFAYLMPANPRKPRMLQAMWFALALAAALTQAGQFAVVKGRARSLSPLVIIFWTQTLGLSVWTVYFLTTGAPYRMTGPMWPWVLASVVLASAMSYLLVRASAGGDISIVGPVLALSPIFAILPDFVFSGTLPRGVGWLGIGLSVIGTGTLSRSASGRLDVRALVHREDAMCAFAAAVILGVLAGVDRRSVLAVGAPPYLVSGHTVMGAGCAALIVLRGTRAVAVALARAHL